jgi:hypothetical protein
MFVCWGNVEWDEIVDKVVVCHGQVYAAVLRRLCATRW